MKKLMVLAVAAAVTCVANASNWNWGATTGKLMSPGTTSAITANATAYLFDAAVLSQQELLTGLSDGTYSSVADAFTSTGVKAAAALSVDSSGKFQSSADFAYGTAGTSYTFYTAIVATGVDGVMLTDNSNAYVASEISTPTAVSMKSLSPSKNAAITTGTFGSTGWYSTVPEPTSGLLLLLGMAGLALRRRRA